MATLAEVLAGHVEEPYTYAFTDGTRGRRCSCKCARWTTTHVAAAVTAHLAEILAADATREAVADRVATVRDEYPRRADDADSEDVADAALAAVRVLLGIEATT